MIASSSAVPRPRPRCSGSGVDGDERHPVGLDRALRERGDRLVQPGHPRLVALDPERHPVLRVRPVEEPVDRLGSEQVAIRVAPGRVGDRADRRGVRRRGAAHADLRAAPRARAGSSGGPVRMLSSRASSSARTSGRRCWRSVGASALRRAIGRVDLDDEALELRAVASPADGRCGPAPARGSRRGGRAAPGRPCPPRIHGGAAPAFLSIRNAIAHSPANASSTAGRGSPWNGRSSNLPSSMASRIWRSTRLSQVGATWRSPCSLMRLGGLRGDSTGGSLDEPRPRVSGCRPTAPAADACPLPTPAPSSRQRDAQAGTPSPYDGPRCS